MAFFVTGAEEASARACDLIAISMFTKPPAGHIALRAGWVQSGDNLPGPHMNKGSWGQQMWLSNRDLCNGFERVVPAGDVRFAVLNRRSSDA